MLVQLNNAYAKKILLTQEAVDFENELIKREKEKAESMANQLTELINAKGVRE